MAWKRSQSSQSSQNGAPREFVVAFLDTNELTQEELEKLDEDEDEEDEFDFNPNTLSVKPPKKIKVKLKILKTDDEVDIICRLPWTWKWLQATIKLNFAPYHNNHLKLIKDGQFQVQQYHLDPTPGLGAINLFFTSICDIIDDEKNVRGDEKGNHLIHQRRSFSTFLQNQPKGDCNLENLVNLLDKFEILNPSCAYELRCLSHTQLPGLVLSLAINQKTFFRTAPILYPKKLASIVSWDEEEDPGRKHKQEAFLKTLEEIATQCPWKFGFNDLMYKETKFSGLEAPLKNILSVFWYEDLSEVQKFSLLTYDMFKSTCANKGHTYLKHDDLPSDWNYYQPPSPEIKKPNMTQRNSAIEFLIEHEILKREVKNAAERFHMMRYWKAEDSICESLEEILEKDDIDHKVDLNHERFERIQKDSQQMLAAKSICKNKVTLVSGRGGTGKTEVVSAVLKAVEEDLKEAEKRSRDEEFKGDSMMSEDGVNSDDSFMSKDKDDEGDAEKKSKNDNMNGPILYCAPTGKAASVIKKRVGSKAYTIHQVISSYKMYKRTEMITPWKFSAVKVVAVDECSMVAIETIQWLLKYLLEGSELSKVVLLGDHQQLPSVEPGNFMEDLFISLKTRGMTVTLMTNHRSEGNIIFDNATKIAKQQMPVFDAEKGFILITPNSENLSLLPGFVRPHVKQLKPSTSRIISTPRNWKHGKSKEMDESKKMLYWSLLKDYKKDFSLENDEKSHIITFMNIECSEVNCYGCWIYNRHMTMERDSRRNKEIKSFHIGDKIICTKNSDIPVIVPDEDSEEEIKEGDEPIKDVGLKYTGATSGEFQEDPNLKLKMETERLMNGNLYKIRAEVKGMVKCNKREEETEDNSGKKDFYGSGSGKEKEMREVTYWVLDDLAGDLIRVIPDMLIKKTKITHAYALTIHKFQGSEADTIVYGVSGSKNENWQHVYTAVTRGKKKVIIVGSYEDLRNAIQKNWRVKRQTALGEKVKRLLKKVETEKKAGKEESNREDIVKKQRNDKNDLGSISSLNQTSIKTYLSPSKSKDSVGLNPKEPLTPTMKLSQELSDSMRLSTDDEWMADLTEDFDEAETSTTNIKRKGSDGSKCISPPKISKPSQLIVNPLLARRGLDFASNSKVTTKRSAFESPGTLRTQCRTESPRSYPSGTSSRQPQPITVEKEANISFGDFGDFDGLNCSQIEMEAIVSSQRCDVKKHLTEDVFGSDDGEDDFGDFDGISDDELADAVR